MKTPTEQEIKTLAKIVAERMTRQQLESLAVAHTINRWIQYPWLLNACLNAFSSELEERINDQC